MKDNSWIKVKKIKEEFKSVQKQETPHGGEICSNSIPNRSKNLTKSYSEGSLLIDTSYILRREKLWKKQIG